MEVRRTLEELNPYRKLRPTELKVNFCVTLTDSDRNTDTLFVKRISETEIVFEQQSRLRPSYEIILTRAGDEVCDAKGRSVTIAGRIKQYDYEGKEL